MPDVQPSRVLAILLGASKFPESPQLLQGKFFYNSAADLEEYLADENGFGLNRQNILSLFDDSRAPSEQLMKIAEFLSRRTLQMKSEGLPPEDLLIYYVGHGSFTSGGDQAYCLAVRSTSQIDEGATSIRAADLAGVVKRNAAFMRRYLIIDSCFAGSIFKEFQSGPVTAVKVQLKKELPERGTVLLCAASPDRPARAPQGLNRTMFSEALIHALRNGHDSCGPRLCFSELGELVKENLRSTYGEEYVRPEVHSPDQREGDVAHIPLFPNRAYRKPRPAKEVPRPLQAEGRQVEKSREKEIAIRVAQELKRAQSAEKSRLAAQEAAADRILKQQKKKRAQDAEKKRLAAEKAAEERARRILEEADAEKKRLKAERASGARAQRIADRAESVEDLAVQEEASPVAEGLSTGALIGILIVVLPVGNFLGYYAGQFWSWFFNHEQASHFMDGFIDLVFLAVAPGANLGTVFAKAAKAVDSGKRLRFGALGMWPGFLAGAKLFNDLAPDRQPSLWVVLCAIVVFLLGSLGAFI